MNYEGFIAIKKPFQISILVFLLLTLSFPVLAVPTIILDGKELSSDNPPIIEGDTMLVPMEAVFNQLGARVKWDEVYQTVTTIRSGNGIIFSIGKPSAWINGNDVPLGIAPQVIDGTTMIPVSILSEGLGARISWDEIREKVLIDGPFRDSASLRDSTFEKVISAPYIQSATDVKQTSDGGFIVVGYTDLHPESYYITNNKSDDSILIYKMGKAGNIEWKKAIGDTSCNIAKCIQCTEDNGFILAGSVGGGDGLRGAIIKFKSSGEQEWLKTFEPCDELSYVSPTVDGGFILTGRQYGKGIWVIKTDHSGTLEWGNLFRKTPTDWAHTIFQTQDTGFVLAGYTFGKEINSGCYPLVLKLDNKGNISWTKIFTDDIKISSLQPTSDGGYLGAGQSSGDVIIMRLNENGSMMWKKTYGGSKDDAANYAIETNDGGFIVAGETLSSPRLSSGYLLKLDKNGNLTWKRTIGTQVAQSFSSVEQTSDGGYIMVGDAQNYSPDIYIVKTDSQGNLYYR
ncbi:MAG: copper amine oxidase N-terminal domain-containing protein [Syntrophomonas sp.]